VLLVLALYAPRGLGGVLSMLARRLRRPAGEAAADV
jgi:hypothetical protein